MNIINEEISMEKKKRSVRKISKMSFTRIKKRKERRENH